MAHIRPQRRAVPVWFALALLAIALATPAAAAPFQPPPAPSRWTTDEAGFLSAKSRASLDAQLEAHERSTGQQVVVYVAKSTGETPLEEWSARAFEAWGIGRKGRDDGMALFVFSEDRALRIEVGYGLEEKVPDVVASRIIEQVAIPRLRVGDPDGAVEGAVKAMLAHAGHGPPMPDITQVPMRRGTWLEPVLGLLLGLGVLAFGAFCFFSPFLLILMIATRGRLGQFSTARAQAKQYGRGSRGTSSRSSGSSSSRSTSSSSRSSSSSGSSFRGGGGRSGGGGASGRW